MRTKSGALWRIKLAPALLPLRAARELRSSLTRTYSNQRPLQESRLLKGTQASILSHMLSLRILATPTSPLSHRIRSTRSISSNRREASCIGSAKSAGNNHNAHVASRTLAGLPTISRQSVCQGCCPLLCYCIAGAYYTLRVLLTHTNLRSPVRGNEHRTIVSLQNCTLACGSNDCGGLSRAPTTIFPCLHIS